MAALALWTLGILLLVPLRRIRAAVQRQVTDEDFRYGESARVPPFVSLPNRNLMNLLELPVLFYVLCLSLVVTEGVDRVFLYGAWTYCALRIVHSLIHVTYNKVMHRLFVFAFSNVVLTVMWIRFVLGTL
jgi:hypothetical protein